MNIGEMPAGRELDALVAERVMGWVWTVGYIAHSDPPEVRRWLHSPDSWEARACERADKEIEPIEEYWRNVPHYSTDIAAAWRVVEKMQEASVVALDMQLRPWNLIDEQFTISSWNRIGECRAEGRGKTFPLAICRAALKAAGKGNS